jgi:hypothetical protein
VTNQGQASLHSDGSIKSKLGRFITVRRGTRRAIVHTLTAAALLGSCLLWSTHAHFAAAAQNTQAKAGKPSSTEARRLAASLGSWTAPTGLCGSDGLCTVGANATLLDTGNVLFWYYTTNNNAGSPAVLFNPVTGAGSDVSLPYLQDIFCSGTSVMPDGRVLVTGGNPLPNTCQPNIPCGTNHANIFDPATSTWSQAADMNYSRWYPSNVQMPDGTTLVMAGPDAQGDLVPQMESYNESTNKWTVLPSSANYPGGDTYPRLSLLTVGEIFKSENLGQTYAFNPGTNAWTLLATTNFGNRYFGGSVLLPGLKRLMIAGGSPIAENGAGTATNTAEIIDFSSKTPAWTYTGSLNYARMNENLVLLPNGEVLAVGGGGGDGKYANPVEQAELYSPSTGTWTVMAAQTAQRTYHSTAVLLPDGRVISAGSDWGSLETTYEIYSPPYLFQGARPTITGSPASVTYGSQFVINTPNYASISSVALIRAGSTTHADNFDQRYVALTFTNTGNDTLTATAPANSNMAPPGYYLLVIVNRSGVPSVMPFVQITSAKHSKSDS